MPTCKYLGCAEKSATIFCDDHNPAKHSAKHGEVAKHVPAKHEVAKHEPSDAPPDAFSFAARGSLGGTRRAERLSPERRSQIAREAAQARWGRVKAGV